jgi:hypothetical protein
MTIPKEGLQGRVIVFIAKPTQNSEPRKAFSDEQSTVQAFGIDVTITHKHQKITIDKHVFGFPLKSLEDVQSGEYTVQAQMNVYEEYQRGDGHDVLLPVSCVNPSGGNGAYDSPVGTLFSKAIKVKLGDGVKIELDQVVEAKQSPGCAGYGRENSEYVKTFRKKSELLSKFWGKEIILEACVLLPFGWKEHPDVKYPLIISHGHYSAQWEVAASFEETEPEFRNDYKYVSKQYGHYLYKNWTSTSSDSPFYGNRMMIATINHPTPFFDDSYAGFLF